MSESEAPPPEPTGSPLLDEVLGILTSPPARPAPSVRLPGVRNRPATRPSGRPSDP